MVIVVLGSKPRVLIFGITKLALLAAKMVTANSPGKKQNRILY